MFAYLRLLAAPEGDKRWRWKVEPGKEEEFRYLESWLAAGEWLDRLIEATETPSEGEGFLKMVSPLDALTYAPPVPAQGAGFHGNGGSRSLARASGLRALVAAPARARRRRQVPHPQL